MSTGNDTWVHLVSQLQVLQDGVADINDSHFRTLPGVEARQYILDKRGDILQRAVLLHTRDQDHLSVLRTRVRNSSQGIEHFPDEILLAIFSVATASHDIAPEFLVSICHRWSAVIYGGVGAKLWCTINLDFKPQTIATNLARRAFRFVERSGSRPLTMILRGAQNEAHPLGSDDTALLHAVVKPCFPRVCKLVVDNLSPFAPWFPIKDSSPALRHLILRSWPRVDDTPPNETPLFAAPCPNLRRIKLSSSRELATPQITSVFGNVSTFASITHMHIDIIGDMRSICSCLANFRSLEYLRWEPSDYQVSHSGGTGSDAAPPLALPNLKTLIVAGVFVQVLSALEAPLVHELYIGNDDPYNCNQDTGLVDPVRFPALKKLTLQYPTWQTKHDVDALFYHPNLQHATWMLDISDVDDLIRCLSLRLGEQVAQFQQPNPPMRMLKWLDLMCTKDEREQWNIGSRLSRQLENLFIYRDALPPNHSLHFKVRLNSEAVNGCAELAALVAKYPDVVSGDIGWEPPDFDEAFKEAA